MSKPNLLYAQSGGVTAVINATACGVIQTARQNSDKIGKALAARNGIIGLLTEDLIDTSGESEQAIEALKHTPGGAFGSCRHKLSGDEAEYMRLIEVLKAHDIGYFLYNGGGDSQDTTLKMSQYADANGLSLQAVGIPKTIDNDLPVTDSCPGFGTTAKYVATSTKEISFDIASMDVSSTKVFVLEVMGRHAGWIAAAAGLARTPGEHTPDIILFPEISFDKDKMLKKVAACVEQYGHCVIVASEGVRKDDGSFLSESGLKDAFGHAQLGGVAPVLSHMIQEELGYKYHWAVADYMQRSARHISSQTDVDHAYAMGKAAVDAALSGQGSNMVTIKRLSDQPYAWDTGLVPLDQVANQEKKMPRDFIDEEGFFITEACRQYIAPLIAGENYPPYKEGVPEYLRLKNETLPKKTDSSFTLDI